MPEFLFRRKKQQNRRRTINDAQDTRHEIQGAKEQLKKKGKPPSGAAMSAANIKVLDDGKDTIRREKEQFMALYKNKYPEEAARLGLTNGKDEPDVGGAKGGGARVNGDRAVNHVNGGSDHLVAMVRVKFYILYMYVHLHLYMLN